MSLENTESENASATAESASLTRRTRRTSAEVATTAPTRSATPRKKIRPVRTLAIFGAVAGMVATVALPAYAALKPQAEQGVTLQQVAEDGAQNLVVASDVASADLDREGYAVTTIEEIEKKKAEEAAAKRAKELADQAAKAAAAKTETSTSSNTSNLDLTMVPVGSGQVIWPLQSYSYIGDGFGSRGGAHDGVDILAPGMTPIYAVADGAVKVSSEGYWGYGVAVVLTHNLNGSTVTSLYGHMTYGTRQVEQGQSVVGGQVIGFVGSTGRSTANHLHFEITINGQLVDPLAWLYANAG